MIDVSIIGHHIHQIPWSDRTKFSGFGYVPRLMWHRKSQQMGSWWFGGSSNSNSFYTVFDPTREHASQQTAESSCQQWHDRPSCLFMLCACSETYVLRSMQLFIHKNKKRTHLIGLRNHHITVMHIPRHSFCTPRSYLITKTKKNSSHQIVELPHHSDTHSEIFFLHSSVIFSHTFADVERTMSILCQTE